MNKKRYAGLLWTKPEKHDKMDTKVGEVQAFEQSRNVGSALVRLLVLPYGLVGRVWRRFVETTAYSCAGWWTPA
jgi:hypothetical protein